MMKDNQIMPDRRRSNQTIHGRTDGDSLSPGKTIELSRLFVQSDFHRVFHKLSCFQGVLHLAIGALFSDSLK